MLSGLSHVEQVRRLVAGGATLIQLRDKTATSGEFYESCADAVRLGRENGVTMIINDRVDIALACEANGVHLGQDDLPPQDARRLLGPRAIIGYSTHSIEQAIAAVKLPVDYIAIGPVFSTTTKSDPDPVVGVSGLRAVRSAAGAFPLVAIGGITRATVGEVFSAGADSAAMISDLITDAEQIADRLHELLH